MCTVRLEKGKYHDAKALRCGQCAHMWPNSPKHGIFGLQKKKEEINLKVWCFNFVHTDCIQSIWCLIKYSCIGTSWEKALSPRWHTGKKFCCHTLTWWLWLVVIDKTVRALIRCTDRPALDKGFYQKSMNLNLHREQSKSNQDKKRTGTIIQGCIFSGKSQ